MLVEQFANDYADYLSGSQYGQMGNDPKDRLARRNSGSDPLLRGVWEVRSHCDE